MSRISPSGFFVLALTVLAINVHAQVSFAVSSTETITGRVTTGGQPVPVVAIILESFDSPAAKTSLPRAITDDEGKYRLAGVPEGRYVVKPFTPALVVLSGPASDKPGSSMSAGVGLTVRRADGDGESLFQMIDARGHFWIKNLPPGLYEITAEADYVEIPGVTPSPYPAPIKQTVQVQNNAESEVLLVLDLKGRGKP
jgi:hypothetical protein